MKVYLVLIVILFSANTIYGQKVPFVKEGTATNEFYPENRSIRNKKIKFIIDTTTYRLSDNPYVHAYDTAGRLIGKFDHSIAQFNDPYSYKRNGDTLLRLKHHKGTDTLYAYDRYVYNKKGQIASYLGGYEINYIPGSFNIWYDVFYYDNKGKLQTRLTYHKEGYSGALFEKMVIDPSKLNLIDVVYYNEQPLANGNTMVIGKHTADKPDWRVTDTTIYDVRKRVIKTSSYADIAALGCPTGNQVNRVSLIDYRATSRTVTSYMTQCVAPLNDNRCIEYKISDENTEVFEYDKNGLLKQSYNIGPNWDKQLLHKYGYVFYQ